MRLIIIPILVLFSLLFISCASVRPPVTEKVQEDKPEVSPTLSNKQERSLKRKVAIARFSNETKYGQGFFYDANDDRLGKQAMDILSAKLSSTGKFIMLERVDISFLSREKEMGQITEMNIPAEYLIVGSVSEFGRKATSDVGVFSRNKKQTAHAKVNIRLVDVRTGMIVYSEESDGEATSEAETVMGLGSTAEYDASLNDKVISAAISKLVNNIIERLLDNTWKSYILSYEDNSYIIAGGNLQGIREGDIFPVYQRGKKVFNPQAKTEIELPGKQIGQLRVVSVLPGDVNTEVSVCERYSGDLPIGDFEDYYIQENNPEKLK
jgi:curli biogenesis system outer membrane secretion channel CsgG